MDESGCVFKGLPSKGMAKKGKENGKDGKKSKQRVTVTFFSADGGKVGKPIVIWKSKNVNATAKRNQVSYFSNPKSWMQVDIMGNVLQQLNREMKM